MFSYCFIVAPEKVSISGHLNAKAGETILLSCESSISNPPAVISWFSRGRPVIGGTSTNKSSPKVGSYLIYLPYYGTKRVLFNLPEV